MNATCPVSVIIPCYNGAKVLPRAVQSVLAQKIEGVEIIIVDDQSTDDSLAVAKALASEHPGVLSHQHPVNSGPAAARNAGLRHARGRYVCFLDADDEYAPGFFTAALALLDTDVELGWISTGIELVNCHREVHPVQLSAMAGSLPSNIIVRAAAAELVGGFPEGADFRGRGAGEDLIFRSALKRLFKGVFLHDKFLRYWVSPGSHFDYFLDRTKVVNDELVFTAAAPEEESGALAKAQKAYLERADERAGVLAALARADLTFPPLVDRLFKGIIEFDEARAAFESVEGFLHPQEGHALYFYAKNGPGKGAIVEIGSLFGRSTCWLAAGTRAAAREKVVAVDHFRGSPEHQKRGTHPIPALAEGGTTLPTFLANLQKRGLRNWVDARVGSSAEIGSTWHGPIRLLFIDADHSFESTRADVETWSKHVVPGGIMAFHDVNVWPGVTDFYRELLAANCLWREVCKMRSLRMVQRVESQIDASQPAGDECLTIEAVSKVA